MSGIYKKINTLTYEVDFIMCDKCGTETQLSNAVDSWVINKGDNYCISCQIAHKLGFFEKIK